MNELGEIQTLIAYLLPRRPVFDHRSVGHVFLRVLRFSPLNICPPMLYTHIRLHTTRIRRTSGRNMGSIKQSSVRSGIPWINCYSMYHETVLQHLFLGQRLIGR